MIGIGLFVAALLWSLTIAAPWRGDEFQAALRWAAGVAHYPEGVYSLEAARFKASLPFIQFMDGLHRGLGISIDAMHVSVLVAATATALWGLWLLAIGGGLARRLATGLTLVGLVAFPFGYLAFAYHYKLGSAGPSIGMLAFGVMTLGLGAEAWLRTTQPKLLVWVAIRLGVLGLLIAIHPLNALLYGAWLGIASSVDWLSTRSSGDLKRLLATAMLGVVSAILIRVWAVPDVSGRDPVLVGNLIRLVNGRGDAGAYFLPWLNRRTFGQEIAFWLALATLLWRLSPSGLRSVGRSLALCSALVALGHALAYTLDWTEVLAADPSRIVALLRPIGFVAAGAIAFERWRGGDRTVASVGAVGALLAHTVSAYAIVPIALLLALGRDRHGWLWGSALAVIVSVASFVRIDESTFGLALRVINWQELAPYTRLGLLILSLTLAIRWIPQRVSGFLAGALSLTYLSWCVGAGVSRSATLRSEARTERAFQSQLLAKTAPSDLIWVASDQYAFGLGLRPTLVAFHVMAYGIYGPRTQSLAQELDRVVGLSLARERVDAMSLERQSQGGIQPYFREALAALTPERLESVRHAYPGLRWLLVENSAPLEQLSRLGVEESLRGAELTLYRVREAATESRRP